MDSMKSMYVPLDRNNSTVPAVAFAVTSNLSNSGFGPVMAITIRYVIVHYC